MRQKYYVHMGPKSAEEVPIFWKLAHLFLFLGLLGVSVAGSYYIYELLDSFNYNCILYAKLVFKKSANKTLNNNGTRNVSTLKGDNSLTKGVVDNTTKLVATTKLAATDKNDKISDDTLTNENNNTESKATEPDIKNSSLRRKRRNVEEDEISLKEFISRRNRMLDREKAQRRKGVRGETTKLSAGNISENKNLTDDEYIDYDYLKFFQMKENKRQIKDYPEGTIAERSSTFATNHMCNLMLFPLVTTTILALMLFIWVCLSARGGRGVAGDLMPYPWMCVYPMILLCIIILIFSIITDRLFRRGCEAFCLNYKQFTGTNECSEKIDKYTAQFHDGHPKPWFKYYSWGFILVKAHTTLWATQLLLYTFRVFCLTDFSIYITRIRQEGASTTKGFRRMSTKDLAMANLILQVVQSREKRYKTKEEKKKKQEEKTV